MRRSTTLLLVAAAFICALPASAKMPWVKEAQKLGFNNVQNCKSCHAGEKNDAKNLTPMGKFLMDQKAKNKADKVDLNWLKDFKK
ncbi:MAG: hypothetical protein IPP78_09600 [Holophagaceae bacterium]|nr:hypothetical protein [Holophagaceae bacterium]